MLPTTAVERRRFERNRARRIPRNKRRLKMPNWCRNFMEITGSSDEIARFKRTCVVFAAEQAHLDFDAIVPVPGILTQKAFDWACEHWGTDRRPWDFDVIREEPNSYECH